MRLGSCSAAARREPCTLCRDQTTGSAVGGKGARKTRDFSAMAPRVLVVEDEPLVREMAVEALRDAGFEVLEAEDGGAALALCGSTELDALFTDIRLPGPISG